MAGKSCSDNHTKKEIRIVLMHDEPVFREGLKLLLEKEPCLSIVGFAVSTDEALAHVKQNNTDMIIIIEEGLNDAVKVIGDLKKAYPELKLIVLSNCEDALSVKRAYDTGADGLLQKNVTKEVLISAINSVINNLKIVQRESPLPDFADVKPLASRFSPREIQIIKLITAGKTNKEIAAEFNLTEGTVKNIISAIFEKAGVVSRTQLASHILLKYPEEI